MSNFHPAASADRSAPRRGLEHLGFAVLALFALLACIPGALAHEFKVGNLEVGHPWSRATPPGAKVAGGYFSVTNNGSSPDRLLSISSEISDKAELHEMGVKDGVMTMRPVSGGLEIPAGGKVALKPGGYHLMFIGLKRQPKQGEKFPATLTFEKAGSVTVEFAVEGMGETGGMDDHAD
jgi:copper(I)-binding protein